MIRFQFVGRRIIESSPFRCFWFSFEFDFLVRHGYVLRFGINLVMPSEYHPDHSKCNRFRLHIWNWTWLTNEMIFRAIIRNIRNTGGVTESFEIYNSPQSKEEETSLTLSESDPPTFLWFSVQKVRFFSSSVTDRPSYSSIESVDLEQFLVFFFLWCILSRWCDAMFDPWIGLISFHLF